MNAITETLPNVELYYGWFGNYETELNIIKNI